MAEVTIADKRQEPPAGIVPFVNLILVGTEVSTVPMQPVPVNAPLPDRTVRFAGKLSVKVTFVRGSIELGFVMVMVAVLVPPT